MAQVRSCRRSKSRNGADERLVAAFGPARHAGQRHQQIGFEAAWRCAQNMQAVADLRLQSHR
jgi:hypothetical protein